MHLKGVLTVALVALLLPALSAPMHHNKWTRQNFYDSYEDRSMEDYGKRSSKNYGSPSSSSGYKVRSVENDRREYGRYRNYDKSRSQLPDTRYGGRSVEDNSIEFDRYGIYNDNSQRYRPSAQYRGRIVKDKGREYDHYKNYGPSQMQRQRPGSRYNGIYDDKNLDDQYLYKEDNKGRGNPSPLQDADYINMY